jgi:hypothetical protein
MYILVGRNVECIVYGLYIHTYEYNRSVLYNTVCMYKTCFQNLCTSVYTV